jgi:hypothetical protein
LLVRLKQEVQEVLWRVKPKPDKPTATFDLGEGQILDSTFEDVESSADRLVVARGGMERSDWRRISHNASGARVDWTAIGAIAGVIAAIAAVVALFLI